MRYQVKWVDRQGEKHYGIFRDAKNNKARVDDAVLPYYHRVSKNDLIDVEMGMPGVYDAKVGGCKATDEFGKFVEKHYLATKKLSDSLPKGVVVGKLFSVGVADGRASYVVTKVAKDSVTVEWRGYCPDRYTDQVLGFGGKFPTKCIAEIIRRQEGLAAIFGR